MKFSYDKEADAAYIKLSKSRINQTVEIGDYVMVDYGKRGNVVGIEILNFSKRQEPKMNLSKLVKSGIPFKLLKGISSAI